MANFNGAHILYASIAVVITFILWFGSYCFNKKKYGVFLGVFLIVLKAIDIYFRVVLESYPNRESLPFHLCNIAIILAGVYLITQKKYLFSVIAYWLFGPIVVVFVPSSFSFDHFLYPVFFFLTHSVIILAVVYGHYFYGHRVDLQGLGVALGVFFVSVVNAFFWNALLDTNFLYVSDYILPSLDYMSLGWYQVMYLGVQVLAMVSIYGLSTMLYKK